MRRGAAPVLIALAAAMVALGIQPWPTSAECPYVPPWPEITTAIPTAREIVVGEIVTEFNEADLSLGAGQGSRDYALRITHVLRGGARPGDLLDIQYLLPNWPWTHFTGADGPTASCSHLRAAPKEVIALAFDALHRGGPMRAGDEAWTQAPTRYSAVGVVKGPVGIYGTDTYRERVTLRQLEHLASLPPTDAAVPAPRKAAVLPGSLLVVTGLVAFAFGLRRFRLVDPDEPFGHRRRVPRARS